MFDPKSRYYNLEEATFERTENGATTPEKIAYKRRRFLPQGQQMPTIAEITVTQGERLDLLTHRLLGDSEQYWQVCDANNAMNPATLLTSFDTAPTKPGQFNQVLLVPLPQTF